MAREINLVPDIKDETIKTLKLRNFIFFICIVVAIGSVVVTAIFGSITGGQQLAIDGKKNTIDMLSDKLKSFEDLSDYLTIKNQLTELDTIADNKKVLSRTFNILSALLPHGADTITISELNIDLSEEDPVFSFDAQANAGSEPFIDYNVLDAFKKSMQYMTYDYGRYIDKYGNEIPAYCMIESDEDGTFRDDERGLYAYWTIYGEGCNPSESEFEAKLRENGYEDPEFTDEDSGDSETSEDTAIDEDEAIAAALSQAIEGMIPSEYELTEYAGEQVVLVWRTPQFADWYKPQETDDEPYMDLDGTIENVAHFKSECITYSGDDSDENAASPTWSETNTSCLLVPDGINGIQITESSNGRDSDEELVLRFSAIITLASEAYQFNNYHMLAFPPSGRRNVTDSFTQIQTMFGKRAEDCSYDDATCSTGSTTTSLNSDTDTSNSRTTESTQETTNINGVQ